MQYVESTGPIRRTVPLHICISDSAIGKALSKKRPASWLCEGITQPRVDKDPPSVVYAQSPRVVAVSTALFSRIKCIIVLL